MSVAADFDKLQRELDASLAQTLEAARSAAASTAAVWRALVEAMTGQPPAALPPAGNGANPAEVRAVLLALCARFERRLQIVERGVARDDDELCDAIWTFRHRRLDSFVIDELAAYIKSVTPRPSIAGAFAKAANAARATPVASSAPSVQLHRCKNCAAPRLSESLYGDCVYCGQPFFRGREEIY